jgi:hypothetical protein
MELALELFELVGQPERLQDPAENGPIDAASSSNLQNGTCLFCPNGSHLCMYDDQETYMIG